MSKFSEGKIVGWTQSKYEDIYIWESGTLASFRGRMKLAFELAAHFDDANRGDLQNAARRNAVVNMVSSLEVYFRDLIVARTGDWEMDGFSELLKDKMSLNDAYDYFKGTTVTKEALVANHYSFQSIESIAFVFDRLTGCDFLKCIDNAEYVDFVGDSPIGYCTFRGHFPEWRKLLADVFNTRHKIVHEAKLDYTLIEEDWIDYHGLLNTLPYAVEWALGELYTERCYNKFRHDTENPDDLPF
ncbi:hypothetical protein KK062_18775 [Fulvivirgaceae bacterium PWU5]|uniref:RiboL-PSP-HEPN domain-containing protein n=1 Tax=Dawidia cretensis TaxID=2782350 RepID=A0AAP2E1K2_9BACT|nr:HEPN domain-containing protein [Dawidia cretensis]MBT1710298.1 hypothetical protein [Dawidia cretensis]